MIPEWLNPVLDAFNAFIEYFQAQTLPVQILLIVLVVLAFIAAAFVVYGALWLAYQAVKAAIVGTILLVWLIVVGVVLLFTVFFDEKKAESIWKESTTDMRWFINKAYPSKHKTASASSATPTNNAVGSKSIVTRPAADTRQVPAEIEYPTAPRKHYCTTCGLPFSNQMHSMLEKKASCFCEQCGQRFAIQNAMAAPVNK